MADISTQKLLYHLTSMDNLESILAKGILPRSQVEGFVDVADHDILSSREKLGLQDYVPFHFFAGSPFDGRVQMNNVDESFIFITVRRTVAASNQWKVMPRHPLGGEDIQILDYEKGMQTINWSKMNERDYSDDESKSVCMAECLSPEVVAANKFCSFFVKTGDDQKVVKALVQAVGLSLHININPGMFVAKS